MEELMIRTTDTEERYTNLLTTNLIIQRLLSQLAT